MDGVRKTVTILFADVVASTELGERLDPEALREIVSRYFDEMADVLERHGGTVEKFIGDEVMAVFGVPAVHEDDALRAVRAAAAMRGRLAALNDELERTWGARLEIRIGINTGEVVAGDPSRGHGFVTGDAVNVAKRIEGAAEPGEVLLGEATHRLVRHAVGAARAGPFALKGKRDPVPAYRLEEIAASPEPMPRRLDAPLVGRVEELRRLRAAYDRAVASRTPQLVTVLGPAGIGKSRLARELLDEVADEADVRIGRCLPYGEGITFWPVREVVPDEPLDGSSEEIFRRVRARLAEVAATRPLVVCFEDVHWGEPTFLDLVQYLAGWMADAPALILCLARPDLLERRPDWLSSAPGASLLALEPLTAEQADALLAHLDAPEPTRRRIAEAAEGNPLFVEQMAAMAAEDGEAVHVPPSISALLSARLDRLGADEAAVVGRASVVGREVPLRAALDLAPDELHDRAQALVLGLVRKELVVPHRVRGEDGFRFRHALIRDAAYEAVPKGLRAELHERHAAWLDAEGADEVLVGYHLEQAVELRRSLGAETERTAAVAGRASDLLARAGRRALERGDAPAAIGLLERALALAESPQLATELGAALLRGGRFEQAETVLDHALAVARARGDRRWELRARIERQFVRSFASPARAAGENASVAESVIRELEGLGDELGLAKAWWLRSETAVIESRWAERADALERALAHARRAPDARHEASSIAMHLAQALYYGPAPAGEGAERCRALLADAPADGALRTGVGSVLAGFLAMQGRLEEARTLLAEARGIADELGLVFRKATTAPIGAEIEALGGDLESAELLLREAYEALEAMGERGVRSTVAACLAYLLAWSDRASEAERLVGVAAELAEDDDLATHVLARGAAARVAARRGEAGAAAELAAGALELAERTDAPALRAAALVACAEAAADDEESSRWWAEARAALEDKGNRVAAERLAAYLKEGAVR